MTLRHIEERLRALATELGKQDRWLDHDACVLAADEIHDILTGEKYRAEVEQDD